MKDTGFTKVIDDLGRIVLPKEIRKKLGMDIRSSVDVYVDGDRIILSKSNKECMFCTSKENLTEFKGKCVCEKCISEMK
ncbi:MAG: AbrB/MazE/SpoVT family DNA-binding domain-containing protein [Porcipelethomonas sp.]